jgi:hypothetical protein
MLHLTNQDHIAINRIEKMNRDAEPESESLDSDHGVGDSGDSAF